MTQATLEKETKVKKFAEDPSVSLIVPVYNIPDMVFKRCLMSLSEQNYKNIEFVLVFDGPNEKLFKIAEPFLTDPRFVKIEIEHAGACAARNAGFYQSTGDVVAFVNSDYVLKRGIVSLWVDKLLENTDCGFVYGGYEYSTRESAWYPSKPFDPYLLEVANYIDCGFPLWRKNFVEWDVNCKSLQDWDFWLRVVKTHKVKGFYMGRDISFVAEPPRPKGLTDDSSSNWVDRVKYVKERNQIPLRDILVTSLGAPSHGIEIAKMIGADYRDDTIFKPNEYKSLYMIGFYMNQQRGNQHGPILSHYQGKKRIVHWVGADIYHLRKLPWEALKNLSGALRLSTDHMLVENEQAKKEIKDLLGLEAEIVPIPPYTEMEVKPLPEKFSVGIFLTEKSDFDKYMREHTLSIVRACPDIQFNSYGDYKDTLYHNMRNHGNLSKEKWKEFVYQNSCLIRLVSHDTTPLASAEFMLAGRSVISNIPKECTNYIDTAGDSPVNEWDIFAPGLQTAKWADTKKKIITELRKIKNGVVSTIEQEALRKRFDKETYIKKIHELSGVTK